VGLTAEWVVRGGGAGSWLRWAVRSTPSHPQRHPRAWPGGPLDAAGYFEASSGWPGRARPWRL